MKPAIGFVLSFFIVVTTICQFVPQSESAHKAFKREPGHPQWHHSAFHDVELNIRSNIRAMLHTRAEVPFQVPLEVNVVLIGFNGDGGYRYKLDPSELQNLLRTCFPSHRPSLLETGEPLDFEHNLIFNVISAEQPELIELEKATKNAMTPAGTAKLPENGQDVSVYEVEATVVEPLFNMLYSYLFDEDEGHHKEGENKLKPHAIFILNFDKVRMNPQDKAIELERLMFEKIVPFANQEELGKQEAGYIYRYRYNNGGATQTWISSDRYVVMDISAGPCTYGKVETEEGTVSHRMFPRLRNVMVPSALGALSEASSHQIFIGQVGSLIATTVEHVIAPDVRFETVDMATRLLVPVIVLRNHNRYNILEQGHNYSVDLTQIHEEINKMVHHGEEVLVLGGIYSLHQHEKLAVAVSKAMRGHSLHETKSDGRFHVKTRTFLNGALLKEELERSADVLAAGLLEMADASLSSKYFLRQNWMDTSEVSTDSVLKHKPMWSSYSSSNDKKKKKRSEKKNVGDVYRTYGTRVIPVFVLSLADVDPKLTMEDEALVWTSKDVVIVLQHQAENIPLSYVSETERMRAVPSFSQRHILAGLASVIGGLTAPYEKASHVHGRPVVNFLWAGGCHPFGPFSNTSRISKLLGDVTLRNTIYARVDAALRHVRESSEAVQRFANEYLKTPVGEPVATKRNKTRTELWLDKFYKKTTALPEPFPHELVERLEKYLDGLEERLLELSTLLFDHRLQDAHLNSSEIFQSAMFTQQYVEHVLAREREAMRCCTIDYKYPHHSSQTYVYAAIFLAGFVVYFVVIYFSKPAR